MRERVFNAKRCSRQVNRCSEDLRIQQVARRNFTVGENERSESAISKRALQMRVMRIQPDRREEGETVKNTLFASSIAKIMVILSGKMRLSLVVRMRAIIHKIRSNKFSEQRTIFHNLLPAETTNR